MSDAHDSNPWLTAFAAADRAHRHPVTLRRALESGELHGHQRRHRGRWHIHVDVIDAWIQGASNNAAACACRRVRSRQRRAS